MKRLLPLIILLVLSPVFSFANHITGGEMFYTFISQNGGTYQFHVTLKLYRDCNAPAGSAQLDDVAPIAIYDKLTGTRVWSQGVSRLNIVTLNLGSPNPCITNPPTVCYQVGYYEFDVSLPVSVSGYIIAYQRCCRISGINNLTGSNSVGVTYSAEIPGTLQLPTAPVNNSAKFIGADTVIVCADNAFTYSFAAQDADGDQLTYSFCDAFQGGSTSNAQPNPPSVPNLSGQAYSSVPYQSPYNGSSPLGIGVTLNTSTGLISGIAPAAGIYVVTVCVTETRNGIIIATQRKDLQIKIGNCDIAKAVLEPQYITCDGFTMSFQNLNSSPLINSYYWDFGVKTLTNDTSNLATPTFTYPDSGVYIMKLVTNRNQQCSDSTTATVKVYPGFFPGFTVSGACYSNPFQFTDVTSTNYGIVDSWTWNFGDPSTTTDVSSQQNPSWTYPAPGPKDVSLIVTNSKGCSKTVQQTINVIDRPIITMAFRDTLICRPDAVQLNASGTGVFNWAPTTNMINANTATPTVDPIATTWYNVTLNDNGCVNKDSVRVRVVNFVTLNARPDTTICLTDAVQLGASTDGLQFQWSPAAGLNNASILNPIATPTATTSYQLIARIGSCTATDNIVVTPIPYPVANAGNDTVICFNTTAQLNGSHDGISFSWSPASYLNDPNILNPVSTPAKTTAYVLSSLNNLGCPKPGRDTVVVTVLPKVKAFAGRDTTVVINQPLQFEGSGGIDYLWSPPLGLNDVTISNPIGIYNTETDSITYKLIVTDQAGCADSAFVKIKVFKTNPYIFVPTAFTPNGDGRNDVIRPIAVGIQKINYFNIYNRWGQLVFTTTTNEQGWDGKISGVLQSTATFVWMVSAIDFAGKPFFLKGTTTLIR